MENSGIIRFSDFFKGEVKTNSNLKKEDFNEFFLPEESITEVFEDAPVVLESLPAASIEDKVEEVIEATPKKKQITKGKSKSQSKQVLK